MSDYYSVGDAAQMQQEPSRKWHKKGSPNKLLMDAYKLSGAQLATLLLLIENSSMKNQFVMPCCGDRFVGGVMEILLCEYTRFYVICFPLTGVILALIVTARMILQRRMYYELLRLKVGLLDFEQGKPLRDPAIVGGLWCMAHALLHLLHKVIASMGQHGVTATLTTAVSNATSANSSLVHDVQAVQVGHVVASVESEEPTVKRLIQGFLVPTALFLAFLKKSYSDADNLVSLYEYVDEDPQGAQQAISSMQVLQEAPLANIARSGLRLDGRGGESEAIRELVQRTVRSSREQYPERKQFIGPFRPQLLLQLWPGKVLLDRRLVDKESRDFRKAWLVFIWPAYFIMAACILLLGYKALVTLGHIFGIPMTSIQKVNLAGGMHVYKRRQCQGDLIFSKFLGCFVIVCHIVASVWFVRKLRCEIEPRDAAGLARLEAVSSQYTQTEESEIPLVSLQTEDAPASLRTGQDIVLNDWQGLTAVTTGAPSSSYG